MLVRRDVGDIGPTMTVRPATVSGVDPLPRRAASADALGARAASGGRWVAVGALVSNAVAALVLLVLAAVLLPADLGVLALGTIVFVVANTLQDFGLFDVLVFVKDRSQQAAETVLLCWLVASVTMATLIVASSPLIARYFGEPRATPVIAVAGVLLVLHAVGSVPLALRTRSLDLRTRAQIQMSAVLVGGVCTVVLVLLGLGIAAMVIGQVVQGVLLVSLAWGVGPRVRPRWHGGVARELFSYGRHTFGASLATVAQYNVDYVIVGRVLGSAALGVYSFSFRLAFLPHAVIALVIASTMFALLCRLEGPSRADAVLRYTRTVLLLVTPLTLGLVLFAPAVTLLGAEWSDAVGVVRWLGVFCLFLSVVTISIQGFKGVGRPSYAFALSLSHLVLITVLLLVVVRTGVEAVAAARAGAAGAVAVVGWTLLARRAGIGPGASLALLRLPALGAAAMAATAWLLPFDVAGDTATWAAVVPQALAALAAYLGAVALADRAALRESVQRVTRRGGPA